MERDQLEMVLATVYTLLEADGAQDAADFVRSAEARVEQSGYDGWNGGTTYWDLVLSVPPAEYARLGSKREQLEGEIGRRLDAVASQLSQDAYSVKVVPALVIPVEWRASNGKIPVAVRQDVFDGLRLDNVSWWGRLNEVEFLQRLYDLQTLPSNDRRYGDAAADIWQHCVNNSDWDTDWVYSDSRFALSSGSEEAFLRFLCEMVHPVVRPDRDESLRLVKHFNDQLRPVGWEIYEEQRIAGRHRFAYRGLSSQGSRSVSRARTVADALDAAWMEKEIQRVEQAVERDPALAIGTAKDLVETCCKTILSKRGIECPKAADLGDLTRLVTKELQLVPEGISEEARGAKNIRLILHNLTSLTHNLAELRGLYGSGHGRDGKYRGLGPRHARLAVGAAVAFIDFVADTYRNREAAKPRE